MSLLRGCDVSVFQSPGLVDWRAQDFGIARATYGTKADKTALEHVKRIRAAGKTVGLYHFFRADQAVTAQVDAFAAVATAAGLTAGDLLPCIDVEDYPGHTIGPLDVPSLTLLDEQIRNHFGGSIIYTTQRDWHRLGKPAWYLERPLWVAHYPKAGSTLPLANAATPAGVPWRIHQCIVGPIVAGGWKQDPTNPIAVDQNLALSPLPLIAAEEPKQVLDPVVESQIPWVGLTDDDWSEMTEARDRRVREL